jgi:hypothetical protein
MLVFAVATPADAAGCSFDAQGEGHVAEIIDSRTFRLQDGREVRLAGIEPYRIRPAAPPHSQRSLPGAR